jgi:hypothetical protein
MRLAVGVRSAAAIFLTVLVHFEVVGHLFTASAIAQHSHVWRMVKLEKFHGWHFTVTDCVAQAVRMLRTGLRKLWRQQTPASLCTKRGE